MPLSPRSRRMKSALANAVRTGMDAALVAALRTAFDVEKVIDAILAIRGQTTTEQRQRLHRHIDATAGDRA